MMAFAQKVDQGVIPGYGVASRGTAQVWDCASS